MPPSPPRLRTSKAWLLLALLAAAAPAAAETTTLSFAGSRTIPDNAPTGTTVSLEADGLGLVTDVELRLDGQPGCSNTIGDARAAIAHPFVGNLVITVISPQDTEVVVFNQRGGNTNNFCAVLFDDDGPWPAIATLPVNSANPVNGNFLPEVPLSLFDGENGNGTWRIRVADGTAGNAGVIQRLSLVLTTAAVPEIIVDRFDDPFPGGCLANGCSLREAVLLANQQEGLDRILLPPGEFTLTLAPGDDTGATGDLDLTEDVEIVGAGPTASVVTQTVADRVLHAVGGSGTVVLRNLGLAGGQADAGGGIFHSARLMRLVDVAVTDNTATTTGGGLHRPGGGTQNQVTYLELLRARFEGNAADVGGALYNVAAGFTARGIVIVDSEFVDNIATSHGGAIALDGVQSVSNLVTVIDGSTFTGNVAQTGDGGAINTQRTGLQNGVSVANVTNSLFEDNSAPLGSGGAIAPLYELFVGASTFDGNSAVNGGAIDAIGSLDIRESTFCSNEASLGGGALRATSVFEGSIVRSTFCNNTVTSASLLSAGGGAVLVSSSNIAIVRSTLAGNVALRGGAITQLSGNLQLAFSTVTRPAVLPAGNVGSVLSYVGNDSSDLLTFWFNILIGECDYASAIVPDSALSSIESPNNTCRLGQAGTSIGNQLNVTGAALALGPLADNGGPTDTRLPAPGSVAIGAAAASTCLDRDQRLFLAVDNACDSGAVEAGTAVSPNLIFANSFE